MGFLIPRVTGVYRFAVAADDQAELRLNPDSEGANLVRIAEVPLPTGWREYQRYPAQVSAPIALTAGRKYSVELLHFKGGHAGAMSCSRTKSSCHRPPRSFGSCT